MEDVTLHRQLLASWSRFGQFAPESSRLRRLVPFQRGKESLLRAWQPSWHLQNEISDGEHIITEVSTASEIYGSF